MSLPYPINYFPSESDVKVIHVPQTWTHKTATLNTKVVTLDVSRDLPINQGKMGGEYSNKKPIV